MLLYCWLVGWSHRWTVARPDRLKCHSVLGVSHIILREWMNEWMNTYIYIAPMRQCSVCVFHGQKPNSRTSVLVYAVTHQTSRWMEIPWSKWTTLYTSAALSPPTAAVSWFNASHCSCVVSHVFPATSLEGSIPLVTDEDPGIRNASFTRSSVYLRDIDRTHCQWTTSGGFPHEMPTPDNQDPLARSHQELRGSQRAPV